MYLIWRSNSIIVLILLLFVSHKFSNVNALIKYCSNSKIPEFRKEFNDCLQEAKSALNNRFTTKNNDAYITSSTTTTTTYAQTTPEHTKLRYEEVLALLDRVTESLKATAAVKVNESLEALLFEKHNTKRLLLDLVQIIASVNDDSALKTCVRGSICNLFKNCELPMNIEYKDWENDVLVASRMASLLSLMTRNEVRDGSVDLKQSTLYSLLRSAVADNFNIYNAKIVFKLTQDRAAYEALKIKNGRLYLTVISFSLKIPFIINYYYRNKIKRNIINN